MMNNDILVNIEDENISVDISDKVIEVTSVVPNPDEETNKYLTKIKINDETFNVGDENTVIDPNYVHTDNNYTDADKLKVSNIPTKTSDLTNDSDFVDSNYVNDKIEALKWELGANDLSIQSDTTTAYQKTVPTGAIKGKINSLGGMSYKTINLYSGEQNKTITVNNTLYSAFKLLDNFKSGTTYTVSFDYNQVSGDTNNYYLTIGYGNTGYTVDANIGTIALSNGRMTTTFTPNNANYSNLYIRIPRYTSAFSGVFYINNIMVNEGNQALPYQPYFTGIRDSAVSSVVSKDSNNTTLDTFTIDSNIQALNGYGWGINDNCYNYIDFENKKFKKVVGRVNLGSLSWAKYNNNNSFYAQINDKKIGIANAICTKYDISSTNHSVTSIVNDPNSIGQNTTNNYIYFYSDTTASMTAEQFATAMSGVYLYYELATSVETDISQYIDDNFVEVEAGGSLTFENTYEQAVPSDITYLIEVAK